MVNVDRDDLLSHCDLTAKIRGNIYVDAAVADKMKPGWQRGKNHLTICERLNVS